MSQVDPALFAVGFVALAACGLAIAAFVASLRSSPARVQREQQELFAAWDAQSRKVQAVEADNASMREEWAEHRAAVTKLLDEAIDQFDRAESRRKSARAERRRAEDTRDVEQQEPAQYECERCRYVHLAGEDCMACARRRFAM